MLVIFQDTDAPTSAKVRSTPSSKSTFWSSAMDDSDSESESDEECDAGRAAEASSCSECEEDVDTIETKLKSYAQDLQVDNETDDHDSSSTPKVPSLQIQCTRTVLMYIFPHNHKLASLK